MLTAYIDDSGTHDKSPNCVIGGYWGGMKEWSHFEAQWNQVLKSEGITEFKANEFWPRLQGKRVGPYKEWNDERHKKFIDRLLKIIEQRKVYPFVSGVLNSEWENRLPVFRRVFSAMEGKQGLDETDLKSMFLPIQISFVQAARYCKEGKRMNFVFDDDPRTAQQTAKIYMTLKQEAVENDDFYRFRFGSLTFKDSKQAAALQAADLLVYEAHRYCKQFIKAENRNLPMRAEYHRAITRAVSKDDFWLFDGARFQRLEKYLTDRLSKSINEKESVAARQKKPSVG
jgi:hypothetical protein